MAQAFAVGGGPRTAVGAAARAAYTSGLSLAMIVGAGLVLAAAVTVCVALPRSGSNPGRGRGWGRMSRGRAATVCVVGSGGREHALAHKDTLRAGRTHGHDPSPESCLPER